MKVAVCAKNNRGLLSDIDERFGRSEFYVVFDTENNETTIVENDAKNENTGAGGKAISLLYKNSVDIIIATDIGPKASKAMKAFAIKAYQFGESKTVADALNLLSSGKLARIRKASVADHSGLRKA